MKILTILLLMALFPACTTPTQPAPKVYKQYRGMSEPAQKYIAAKLILCDDFARKNAIVAANEGYSESEVLQAYKLAQDSCVMKEKLAI